VQHSARQPLRQMADFLTTPIKPKTHRGSAKKFLN
jgi:hypothetical protein